GPGGARPTEVRCHGARAGSTSNVVDAGGRSGVPRGIMTALPAAPAGAGLPDRPRIALSFFRQLLDIALHIDQQLDRIIQTYGAGTYGLLFVIIFCETGLVVTPFLPGDSLLFAVGAFAARGSLDLGTSLGLLMLASICGDSANYLIGSR